MCRERWMILSYFAANDTILIFEPPKNNSGVVGGKYLERSIVCKPKSAEQFLDKYVCPQMRISFTRLMHLSYRIKLLWGLHFSSADIA